MLYFYGNQLHYFLFLKNNLIVYTMLPLINYEYPNIFPYSTMWQYSHWFVLINN